MATLTPVRFYTPQDVYYYEDDNRPLTDLANNVQTVAEQLDEVIGTPQSVIPLADTSPVINVIFISSSDPSLADGPLNGQVLAILVANSNTGPATLVVNGTSYTVLGGGGTPLLGGEMKAGMPSLFVFDVVSGCWLLYLTSSGTLAVNQATNADNLLQTQQLQDFTVSFVASGVTANQVTAGNATFGSTVTAPQALEPPQLVTYAQIEGGLAQKYTYIDWTDVTSDAELLVGQTAYYIWNQVTNSTIPLYMACETGQVYDLTIVTLSVNVIQDLNLSLLPNNTTYSAQFNCQALETGSTNQGQFYAPPSSTAVTGISVPVNYITDNFFFDDVAGGAGGAPFLRNLRIWVGGGGTVSAVMGYGGGGAIPVVVGSYVPGVDLVASTWADQGSTSWTSLGSLELGQESGPSAFTTGANWSSLVLIKRIL